MADQDFCPFDTIAPSVLLAEVQQVFIPQAVPPQVGTELEKIAPTWAQTALAMPARITTETEYLKVVDLVKQGRQLERDIEEHHDPIIKSAHHTHKVACEQKQKLLGPVARAVLFLKGLIGTWDVEQERKRREEQQRLQAEADRLALAERQRQIDAAKDAGNKKEARELAKAPVMVVPVAAPPPAAKAAGVSVSRPWKARVVSIKALCQAIGEGKVPMEFVEPNMSELNAEAKRKQARLAVPGVEAYQDVGVSVR